ncbi:hypothetical protein HUE56_04225 (plasmid) [Azospirillum oryzae]|uniref:Uncharacterized protein n=1 Tax=Azospirillum oryzae TaxID=286727 RepID=A0A6N1ADI1_9PROT|nr:hypothetical protein [Azospirillum oryzae]KAA0585632.1 hypothetical protein FZ938_25195 [Azospirillum oryzae]QKS49751.1 hypothetical protein HUE56_04225 [Azospirillum oryzae]GLR79004.1 hypothetical protein GCM10007856_16780 [Azospirillum oryzae]
MMTSEEEAAGMAALSICESLVIAMVEKGLLTVEEARGVLEDAAAAHLRQEMPEPASLRQELAVRFIERLALQVDAAGHYGRS